MPGNEYGERMHNFFGQEGLSQDQHQSQAVDGSWSSFSNGLVGNQRQIDSSLNANLKSYSTQHSVDPERGQSSASGQSSSSQHGLIFTQQPIRSEYVLQEHQQPTNGYMHGNLVMQASPNEARFLGVDAESSRDRLSARGFTPDLHKIPTRFEMGESPVNYDFFAGQQQLNSQLPGMLQHLPRQKMTFNDIQLLKQQVMVKQMNEYQMQQLEAGQLKSLNSNAFNGSRSSNDQSHSLITGISLQNASSNCWQPDLMTGNTNWMHRGVSPGVQSSSSGLMITPEHGQANLLAQNFQPSLYGMPVGGANAPQNTFSSAQMNGLALQHGSANRSASLTNQPTAFLNQGDVHDSNMFPVSAYQEKMFFSHTSVPGSNNRPNFENFQQDDSRERTISVQEKFVQMEGSGLSEKSFMKAPGNKNALQKSTALDPTEEKILFGSDENLRDAFGNSTDMSLTGNLMSSSSDLYDACPSLHSGSWSALMLSAVAETCSDDAGVHEWGSKQQSVRATNNTDSHENSHISSRAHDLGVKSSNALIERLHSDSTRTAVQHLQDRGNHVSDHGLLEKPMAENTFHSSSSGIDGQNSSCSFQNSEGIEDKISIWKKASNPNLAALKEESNHFTQNQEMQRASYGFGIACAGNVSSASREVQGSIQQYLDNNSVEKVIPQLKSRDGSQILESYASNNARDLSMDGGKETQSGHVGCRPSIPRKFQYHPMGNIDVTDEPRREKASHSGQSKSLGQPAMNTRFDKGYISQNDLNCTNEAFNGMGSENSRSTSASAERSVDGRNQVKSASSRLELLHKVDQSQEHSLKTNISGIPEATTSVEYDGQFRHSPSSTSQGFSLQLAPPSQPASSPDNVQFSRNGLQPLNSLHTAPEKGGTSQTRFAPSACNQTFPQRSTYQGPFPGIPRETNITSGFPYSRGYHQNQLMPAASRHSAANHLVSSSSELSTPQVKERDECSDIDQRGNSAQTPSLLNHATHNNIGDSAEGFPMLSTSQPQVASSVPQSRSTSGMMSDSRAGISAPQHRFWTQPSKPQPDTLRPHPLPNNNIEGSSLRQEKTSQLSSHSGGDVSLSGRDMVMHELQSKDMGAKQTSDVASMFSKMQNNLQTLDRFLPSNNLPSDSLHHDEHTPKIIVKGIEDGAVHPQKVASAGDNHQQISPQMAPSWYSQYGTFKNGLVQPANDTWSFTHLKIEEQSSNVGNSVDGSHSVQSSNQFNKQQMPGSAPEAETLSSESLPHGATDKFLKFDKRKKRRTATSELLSWKKEVIQVPQRLKTLGEAEVDWARATKRFPEKVEFETFNQDVQPIKSKRRLIYTTQLLQQLFGAPPANVMSLVASSNYEFVTHTAARAALGDACSSTSTERRKTEKINDQYISKAAEDFISRTQKLETDFARLEKGTTISDLNVEVQDLDKFAVINRFARFHPSSSSMNKNMSSLRLNLQRYVTIAPMPQNIPDRLQCLSL